MHACIIGDEMSMKLISSSGLDLGADRQLYATVNPYVDRDTFEYAITGDILLAIAVWYNNAQVISYLAAQGLTRTATADNFASVCVR
jgi:hypothetical protein